MFDFTGSCVGRDQWHTLDDLGMCDACTAKFDRDLLRQRAWDYSATAFVCDPNDYKALRQAVIDNYGAAYELLADTRHLWLRLDRGLEVFQRYGMNDAFNFANRLQQYRACKAFEVTYLHIEATNESGDAR